ncbi:hypothetical protein BD560DRAFT_425033 [Blakeslea trispora]|nr:hypothetical protein BD560DRAFT_425033 [Blakeslea trispora]
MCCEKIHIFKAVTLYCRLLEQQDQIVIPALGVAISLGFGSFLEAWMSMISYNWETKIPFAIVTSFMPVLYTATIDLILDLLLLWGILTVYPNEHHLDANNIYYDTKETMLLNNSESKRERSFDKDHE